MKPELVFRCKWNKNPLLSGLMRMVGGDDLTAIMVGNKRIDMNYTTELVTIGFVEGTILDKKKVESTRKNLLNAAKEMGYRVYDITLFINSSKTIESSDK